MEAQYAQMEEEQATVAQNDESFILGFEQFMDNFWFYGLDIELHLEGCTSNSQNCLKVIQSAVYLLSRIHI